MATAWNKVTKQYIGRINRPLIKDLPDQENWIVDPNLPTNPRKCVFDVDTDFIRAMTEAELLQEVEDREAVRQDKKSVDIKSKENSYRNLCIKYGLSGAVKAEDGLQDALVTALMTQLESIGDPKITTAFEVIIDTLIMQNLATKINVDDIPDSGHQL